MLRRTTVAVVAAALLAAVFTPVSGAQAQAPAQEAASTNALVAAEKASIQHQMQAAAETAAATYTVVSGDTLSGIAGRHATTWQTLWNANQFIANPNLIYPRQVLAIPAGSSRQTPAATPAPASAAGAWANPLPGACLGSPWNEFRRGKNGPYYHQGWDLPAGYGTAIRAAGNGRVHSADWQGGGGNTVIINHQNNVYTTYMHMSSFAVGGGQWVSAGQVIGYVGSTGDSSGPHLHLEVHWNGPWAPTVNPVQFLRDRGVWLGC